MKKLTKLNYLKLFLHNNSLVDLSVKYLCEGFTALKFITNLTLVLSNNLIEDNGSC